VENRANAYFGGIYEPDVMDPSRYLADFNCNESVASYNGFSYNAPIMYMYNGFIVWRDWSYSIDGETFYGSEHGGHDCGTHFMNIRVDADSYGEYEAQYWDNGDDTYRWSTVLQKEIDQQ